jgi:lyso-ornithine lipid O-acyltransferase
MLRLLWRCTFFAIYTAWIVLHIRVDNWFGGDRRRRAMRIRQRWAKNLLRGTGVRVIVEGTPPKHPCVIVTNHRSYLDPILILRDVLAYPVSKDDLADWPLIGPGAKQAGTLFVPLHDASFRRARLLLEIGGVIEKEGYPVIIFPEGTTSDLVETLPFKKGVFQLAARQHIDIVPAALIFESKTDCWVTQESFLAHAWRQMREPHMTVRIHYGPTLQGTDGETLMNKAQAWVNAELRAFPIK